MKHAYKLHLIGVMVLAFCVSCGQTVKETVIPVIPETAGGQFKQVVIVPLADHTKASSLKDHCRRNTLVLEAMQDAFYKAGFVSAAEEDVVQYLLDRGVIQAPKNNSGVYRTADLEQELVGSWSDEMKEELQEVIFDDLTARTGSNEEQAPIALSRKIVADLGDNFGADYVVRGRIIEYNAEQKDSFNPLRTGLIPFVFKSGQRTVFGVAESDGYEKIDTELLESYDRMQALGWGAVGFVAGLIGEKEGRVRGATVQLRLLVQDSRTGQVLWLNRAEACTTPTSAFAAQSPDMLFAKAIEKAVNSLVADFASAHKSGRMARPQRKVESAAAPVPAEVSQAMPYDQDKRYSNEAEESAQQARDAAEQAIKAAGESERFSHQAEAAATDAKESVKKASEATKKSEKIFEKIITK